MEQVQDIGITHLTPHPDNTKYFHDIEGEAWQFFKADIKRNGILQPLLVTGTKEEGYIILSGHQRYRAAKALGLKGVPAIIIDGIKSETDILFSANLARQLTTMERYRLTIHLLERMEDGRKDNSRGDKKRQNFNSVNSGPNKNETRPRDRVCQMVPGINRNDITTFRRIQELPAPVQQELFKFVEKENPNKKALKEKVNILNADKRHLKAQLRAEKKLKMKKKEFEELKEYNESDIDPRARYDAKCFDETNSAINRACVEVPRLIADVLSFNPLRERTAQILQPSVDALVLLLLEQRQLLMNQWENRDRSLSEVDQYNGDLEHDAI